MEMNFGASEHRNATKGLHREPPARTEGVGAHPGGKPRSPPGSGWGFWGLTWSPRAAAALPALRTKDGGRGAARFYAGGEEEAVAGPPGLGGVATRNGRKWGW